MQDEEPVKKVVCGDHDYLELLVKVKEEKEDPDEMENDDEVAIIPKSKIKIEPPDDASNDTSSIEKDKQFFNLSQLAEVSLAMEGRSEDKALTQKVRAALARSKVDVAASLMLPKVPLPPAVVAAATAANNNNNSNSSNSNLGARTMQIVLPDNASHIIICTNNNGVAGRLEIANGSRNPISDSNSNSSNNNKVSNSLNTSPSGEGHICSDCGKRYSTSSNLARHKQTHRYML